VVGIDVLLWVYCVGVPDDEVIAEDAVGEVLYVELIHQRGKAFTDVL
jgi:hypothetical protein